MFDEKILIVATKPSLYFLNIAKEYFLKILLKMRYNAEAYEQFVKLDIPILTDDDEWKNYHSVKKDPVLHVDVVNKEVFLHTATQTRRPICNHSSHGEYPCQNNKWYL